MALEKVVESLGLTEAEAEKLIRSFRSSKPKMHSVRELPFDTPRVRFTVISDLHMGHKCYRPDILAHAIKYARKNGSEFFLIPGDILEGMSGREGHIYELSHVGASNQLAYAEEQLGSIPVPVFAITATNSHDGWYSSKNNAGFEVGPELERRLGKKRFSFEGYDEATLKLANGLTVSMTHPGDGTAYAISYKLQKYINSLSGGKKPDVLFQGHYHKSDYIFYRNVHAFDAGTLCEQTNFMRKKMSPAMLGYWFIDIRFKKGSGVQAISPEFIPFYE
jgi:predicted phosphodiesterase